MRRNRDLCGSMARARIRPEGSERTWTLPSGFWVGDSERGSICGSFAIYAAWRSGMRLLQHICAAFGGYAVRRPDMRLHRDICGATVIYEVLWPKHASSKKEVNKHEHFLLAFGLVAQSVARYAAALAYMRGIRRICGAAARYAAPSRYMRRNRDL